MSPAPGTRRPNGEWLRVLGRAERASADGIAAQEELRSLIQGALRRATAGRPGVDQATLDDLTQIAMLQVLSKLDRFEGRSQFTTWAYSVAVRAAFTELRRSRSREAPVDEAVAAAVPDDAAEPGARSEREEIVDVLNRVIERDLTERQRTAVRGELAERPQAELLAELGINRNALYKLLYDARQKLYGALCAAGICDDEVREAFDL
jgi:RNA polymerase sigma-70 factor (ECF subfamily)